MGTSECPRCAELRERERRAEAVYDRSGAADARVLMERCRRSHRAART
ncbi:hypothetical protein [Streptomyces sp. SID11385]|nr:hypothetical protein [Streptomyces sp. SID11385]NEA41459.1 hypothetical protein [Streptomyces sp. SID11385]